MKIVITTVGTSIFTNYLKVKNDILGHFKELENYSASEWDKCCQRIKKVKDPVLEWAKKNFNSSAEIKSLKKIQEELNDEIEVILIATDTIVSELAGHIIIEVLKGDEKIKFNNEVRVIKDLDPINKDKFEKSGFMNLIEEINNIKKNHKEELENDPNYIILNITGGYKALIPFITLFCQLNDFPIYYIYEDSDSIINIQNFPISFDWNIAEKYYPYLCNPALITKKVFRELKNHNFVIQNKGLYENTALGNLIKEYIEKNMSISKNVFGFYIEYKLYEYFINNPYNSLNHGEYKFVDHCVKDINITKYKNEIDIVLFKNKKDIANFIAIEIKSFLSFFDKKSFIGVKEQIEEQFKKFVIIPKEYHLYIYLDITNENTFPKIYDHLDEIKNIIPIKCELRIFYFLIEYSTLEVVEGKIRKHVNPLHKFMLEKLGSNQIKEYKLNRS